MSQEDTTESVQTTESTQEPVSETKEVKVFDEGYVKQLRSEAAKYRTEAQEARGELSKRQEAEQSDLEKAQTKAAKYEQEAKSASLKLLRYEVANDKKVPAEAVDLLQGSSREDFEVSADKILNLVKTQTANAEFDGGAREPAPEPESPEQAHNKLLLNSIFGSSQI